MGYGLSLLAVAGVGKAVAGLNPAEVNFTLRTPVRVGIPIGDVGLALVGLAFRKKVGWIAGWRFLSNQHVPRVML